MIYDKLVSTIQALSQEGKGILAADESIGTIGKRFESIGIENTEAHRRDYRLMLATTPELEKYISGVILFEETLSHEDEAGHRIPMLFEKKGIVPGIKVDKGLVDLVNFENEKVTQGMDGLTERLVKFSEQGARFAKWRNVYHIGEYSPSIAAVKTGADLLARYAAICQSVGIVPIVEPEVLMDGDHDIETCADVSAMVLQEVFEALYLHQVELELIVLKPSMVTSGKQYQPFSSPEEIADFTVDVFRHHVPAAVPTINFLSGGQTSQQATLNLQAINEVGTQPWKLSFSYGRALQEDCLQVWKGRASHVAEAQAALLKRARLNALASMGEYHPDMED